MRRAIDWTFKSRETGKITIWQFPNAPLWVWIVATVVHVFLHWTALSWIAGVALAVWAVLEVARGVNPFRRGLGAVVLLGLVARVVR